MEIRTVVNLARDSDRWSWRPAKQVVPDSREYAYSADEVGRLLAVYGRLVAVVLRPSARVRRFRITVHMLMGDRRMVGAWEWRRSRDAGPFHPVGRPQIRWSDGHSARARTVEIRV